MDEDPKFGEYALHVGVVVYPVIVGFTPSELHLLHIGSSSIYRGELSFLPLVQFCICSCGSAILTSYLFRQWPACVRVPNWKNVLGVSGVIRCVWHFANWKMSCVIRCVCVWCLANWKNVLCHKMCIVARVGNTSDARVARSYHKNFPVSQYL